MCKSPLILVSYQPEGRSKAENFWVRVQYDRIVVNPIIWTHSQFSKIHWTYKDDVRSYGQSLVKKRICEHMFVYHYITDSFFGKEKTRPIFFDRTVYYFGTFASRKNNRFINKKRAAPAKCGSLPCLAPHPCTYILFPNIIINCCLFQFASLTAPCRETAGPAPFPATKRTSPAAPSPAAGRCPENRPCPPLPGRISSRG